MIILVWKEVTIMNYKEAKKRVEDLKGYYVHLSIYTSVMLMLFLVDYIQGEGWWFYWAALGWGIGVIGHTVAVFFEAGFWGREWEEKKVKELMAKV
jgi:hypothetical protein